MIQNEKITAIGDLSYHPHIEQVIDASGLFIFPGAIDTHVHFNDVFMNTVSVHDYYLGTLAAAFGGVTSVIDFSNQRPGEPLIDTIKYKEEEAKGKAGQVSTPLLLPPQEEIAKLFNLALKGKNTEIKVELTQLEKLDAKYAPFVAEIGRLAKGVKLKQIRKLLKSYMDQGHTDKGL